MITQINDSTNLITAINQVSTSHFVINNRIYQDQLQAVELKNNHIFCDYTVNGTYINMYTFFGETLIDINQLLTNTFSPAIIYHTEKIKIMISEFPISICTEWDLVFALLITEKKIFIDGHVVFDFSYSTFDPLFLKPFLPLIKNKNDLVLNFKINRFSAYHHLKIESLPEQKIKDDYYLLPDRFQLYKFFKSAYSFLYKRFMQRKQNPYSTIKSTVSLKNHIVFLGFDYHYRGNSKYLYDALMSLKENGHPYWKDIDIYFVSADSSHFIDPVASSTKSLIASAKVVILESFKPDDIVINGVSINLWHGIPIKRLFLDSKELNQNSHIFLYRLRKYRALSTTNYFVTDSPKVNHIFRSAFPFHKTILIDTGYPRVEYLIAMQKKHEYISSLKQSLDIENSKPIVLYCPTWKDYDYVEPDFTTISEHYEVLVKGHPESTASIKGRNVSHLSTEDALLVADIVISDYSSIIFDALNINKSVLILMDDFEQYSRTRGIYDGIMETLFPIYFNWEDLLNDFQNQQLKFVSSHQFCHNHEYATASIINVIEKNLS
ncbi:CDP-glycerol glycerophosphotransferase family protein [Macrococcus lamae]|uniref:Teichoic acid biosynthesis protein F n=1 Tax=Macrococcus lamae TaxID=198484 RepID=A0A4R6BVU5_9STAP|nr:CDP-glycerol glycerophosphotransferase family protein [Macrococcus lamae]TDM12406.1 hypothetical protein ERX29_03525 [Macrococcus lamae]